MNSSALNTNSIRPAVSPLARSMYRRLAFQKDWKRVNPSKSGARVESKKFERTKGKYMKIKIRE
jgi:hypothetical protein